jgi:glycerophosphoryl diester phosphodiesterase
VDHRKRLYIEVKMDEDPRPILPEKLVPLLENYRPAGDVVVHSFDETVVEAVRSRAAHLDLQYGFLFSKPEALEALSQSALKWLNYLHPSLKILLSQPAAVFDHQLPVNTWTVNQPEELERIRKLNEGGWIEAIMTDDLSLCRA